jgi:hypothetical protein
MLKTAETQLCVAHGNSIKIVLRFLMFYECESRREIIDIATVVSRSDEVDGLLRGYWIGLLLLCWIRKSLKI